MKNIIIILILLLTSCISTKYDNKKLSNIDRRHPQLLAEKCNDKFKSTDSVKEIVKYIQGEPIIKNSVVRVNIDSLIKTLPPKIITDTDTFFMNIVCPPSIIRIDTIHSDKTITSTYAANVYILEKKQDSLHLEVINAKSREINLKNKVSKKNNTILILSSILGLIVIWSFIKKYIKNIIKL